MTSGKFRREKVVGMMWLLAMLFGVAGAVGIVITTFLTNRELVARYGFGGQRAIAQAEADGTLPKKLQVMSRLCLVLMIAGMVLFAMAAFGAGS